MFQKIFVISVLALAVAACGNGSNERAEGEEEKVCTVDSVMQAEVEGILGRRLEQWGALSGQAIVMDVRTGAVKALVGLKQEGTDGKYVAMADYCTLRHSGLFRTVSMLAMLETGKVAMDDVIDTEGGILTLGDGSKVYDHNWRRGGYGTITMEQGYALWSDVAHTKCLLKAFPDEAEYNSAIKMMTANVPYCIYAPEETCENDACLADSDYIRSAVGYNKCSLVQLLALHNAIANRGMMVQPHIYGDSTVIINPHIASPEHVGQMAAAMRRVMTDGLGQRIMMDLEDSMMPVIGDDCAKDSAEISETIHRLSLGTAGTVGRVTLDGDNDFQLDFYGFFPIDNPQYSIIVSVHTSQQPSAVSIVAGGVFAEILYNVVTHDAGIE